MTFSETIPTLIVIGLVVAIIGISVLRTKNKDTQVSGDITGVDIYRAVRAKALCPWCGRAWQATPTAGRLACHACGAVALAGRGARGD